LFKVGNNTDEIVRPDYKPVAEHFRNGTADPTNMQPQITSMRSIL